MTGKSMRPTDLLLAFMAGGIAAMVLAAATAVGGRLVGWDQSDWAGIHLALLGGVSLLIIGVSQFFVTAFLATSPPSRRMVRAQIGCWLTGAVGVVAGVTGGIDGLVLVGSGLLLVTLGLYATSLAGLHSRSLQTAPWASRWYSTCAIWLVCGIAAGILLALHVPWSYGSLLGAHLAFNVAGWLGGAIVGTLHTFAPSLTQTRLRFPRLQPATYAAWSGGCGSLALGYGFGSEPAALVGWALLATGATLLAINLVASGSEAKQPLSLPARLVVGSQIFLPLGLAAGLVSALEHPLSPVVGNESVLPAILLLVGWVGLTVIGSMLHLLAIVVHVRDLARPATAADPLRDGLLAGAALGAVGLWATVALAGLDGLTRPAQLILVLVMVALAVQVIRSALLALRLGPHGRGV